MENYTAVFVIANALGILAARERCKAELWLIFDFSVTFTKEPKNKLEESSLLLILLSTFHHTF